MTHPAATDLSRFFEWRQNARAQDERSCRAEFWLFTHVAVVLFAGKAGELLTLDLHELEMTGDEAESMVVRRCHDWELDVRILIRTADSLKMVVYRPDQVDRQLAQVPPCILHGRLRYPHGVDSRAFLDAIADRWNSSGAIPHEIGFALGYAVDDVLGYMGIETLECKGFCGWQVFGDWDEAQRRRCAYQAARSSALRFVAA